MRVLRVEYSEELAGFYVEKLESEIFSLYYHCLDTYKVKADQCAENLRSIIDHQMTLDCVMTTSIDFNAVVKRMTNMSGGNCEAMDEDTGLLFREKDNFTEIMTETIEVHPPSDGSDGSDAERRQPQRMDLEDQLGLSDQIDEKTVSFGFLEELTKVREEEIKKLKSILNNIQKENQILKDALVEVKGHLIALESSEQDLDRTDPR